ncbi:helix-turn-helix transcriptional regulator [Intestinibacter bartlettii]|uniref:helix-turn-helix transcriptional regulator n=1 Tax=Intestinibacter bartlettii TaxID=261299 RepID=UPI000822F372|nr:helix-turn-helix transcriptional regulator [Intestinibacter bartlettii]SCJ11191.1 Helix-turn-helix [uncultured Clostridium sp.]
MKKLKAARVELGLTQMEVAKLMNMHISTYRKKEQGYSEFSINEAFKISEILNKSVEEIFFKERVSKLETKAKRREKNVTVK